MTIPRRAPQRSSLISLQRPAESPSRAFQHSPTKRREYIFRARREIERSPEATQGARWAGG